MSISENEHCLIYVYVADSNICSTLVFFFLLKTYEVDDDLQKHMFYYIYFLHYSFSLFEKKITKN